MSSVSTTSALIASHGGKSRPGSVAVQGECSAVLPDRTQHSPLYERWRWRIFAITWLAYVGFYLTRKSFSVAKIPLADAALGGWSKSEMAWADGVYLTTYAIGQFLFGALGDHYGTRKVVLGGMLASIVVAAACGSTSLALVMIVLLGIQGLCQASGWAPLAKNMGEFFSQHERGRVFGFWMTNYAVGGFLGTALAAVAVAQFGWQAAFYAPAIALSLVWVLFHRFQVNRPEDVGLPPIEQYHHEQITAIVAEASPTESTWAVVGEVFRNRMVWVLAAVYFFLKPTRYLLLFWAPMYLHERLGATAGLSGALSSLFDLAGLFSVIAGGFVSDRLFQARRMPICVISLLLCAGLLFSLDAIPSSYPAYGAALFLIGFLLFIPDSLVSGTAAIDFGTKQGASTAAGLINGSGSVAAILGCTLPGWIEQMVGPGEYIWNYVFVSLAISLLAAALLLLPHWNAMPAPAPANGQGGRK